VSLLICRTCPRYDPRRTGRFGDDLSAALPAASDVHLRFVQCLGGCPEDGVAAVDGPGKARVRFTGLDAGHADALLTAARAHAACGSGEPGDWQVPAELTARLSSVTPKHTGAG
jgi:predicted metal-binding protein